jgi:rhodanese-related sulfurtransferase
MSEIRRIAPEEASALLAEGYVYVDVRSEPEFEGGHVPGAYNVPISHQGPSGLVPNPDFLDAMQAAFEKGERLVVGCRSGARSLRAAKALVDAGFQNVVDLRTGWEGARDAFGKVEPGWSKIGLPTELGSPEGRRYADVRRRRG